MGYNFVARRGMELWHHHFMPTKSALEAIQEQLKYWEDECALAHRNEDAQRIARCERFIQQCKLVIAALNDAAQGVRQ
jgi:hypothetical protein